MPADTDLPDTLLLGLTGHHLLLAAPGVAAIFLGALLGALGVLPAVAVAVGVLVVGGATAGVVACSPDGLTYDRFLRARLRHRRAPAVEVAADALAALPAWTGAGRIRAASLGLLWEGLEGGGVVALGRDDSKAELGFAAVLRLAALDQEALDREAVAKVVARLGAWLSALDCDAQVLVRSRPLELSGRIAELEGRRCGCRDWRWPRSRPPGRRHSEASPPRAQSASPPMSCCAGLTARASPTGCAA
jgi:hypothetical protein